MNVETRAQEKVGKEEDALVETMIKNVQAFVTVERYWTAKS